MTEVDELRDVVEELACREPRDSAGVCEFCGRLDEGDVPHADRHPTGCLWRRARESLGRHDAY